MSMKVRHNAAAQMSLGILNQNQNELGKTLQRLSSGQKFNGANGEGASYVISERMLEQIRSLFQDDQNVQNGASMLKTAERGVDQIISNLRTMKEKAIDAANDSNTDEDRRTIQKELDQRREIINDIAIGTQYNEKILLDGRYGGTAQTITSSGAGGKNTSIRNIKEAFVGGDNSRLSSKFVNGGSGAWRFHVDKSFESNGIGYFSVDLNFSAMKITGSYPTALHGQGFTILCSGCEQYISILFDASREDSYRDDTPNTSEDGTTNSDASTFIIGVKGVTNVNELANAVFEGVARANVESGSNDIQLDERHDVRMKRDLLGKISIVKDGPAMQFIEGTIPNPATNPIPPVKVDIFYGNPLWIQHGTQAGQRMHVHIGDMQSRALGIDAAEVVTKEKANDAIGIIESAIETALDEATNLGAYLQRLEYTGSNVMTMRDNVQASESTIRDADMAKEMTEYMKYNLLSQSAQSMLAQANQNASSVLGFLQQ